jgi:hypothetical protein
VDNDAPPTVTLSVDKAAIASPASQRSGCPVSRRNGSPRCVR